MKKKSMVIILICLVCLFIVSMISGCDKWLDKWRYEYYPLAQPGSEWVSENGDIYFKISESDEDEVVGTITKDGEIYDVGFCFGPEKAIHVFDYTNGISNTIEEYEWWYAKYKNEDEFTVKVTETTFFEEGQRITFHKIVDSSDSVE